MQLSALEKNRLNLGGFFECIYLLLNEFSEFLYTDTLDSKFFSLGFFGSCISPDDEIIELP